MRHLRHPTVCERATVTPEARLIVDQEYDAPAGATRKVKLLTPPAPLVAITIDTPPPAQMGPGRAYQMVQLPPSSVVALWLQPQQVIYAALANNSEGGQAMLGYICEYWDEESA